MICQICTDMGQTSIVYVGHSSSTLMYCTPFYDEQGKYHHHDGNTITTHYSCSNGHKFAISRTGTCWCGWGKTLE